MKVFTNIYPILGPVAFQQDGSVDKDSTQVEYREGKVFKVAGVSSQDILLESEGKMILLTPEVFNTAFIETELSI